MTHNKFNRYEFNDTFTFVSTTRVGRETGKVRGERNGKNAKKLETARKLRNLTVGSDGLLCRRSDVKRTWVGISHCLSHTRFIR